MSAQDQTLQQYHRWMQLNAVSHVLRAARNLKLFDLLRGGQHTLEQICEELKLHARPTGLILDALVAIGIVEQYQDDYALSRAAQLLCQYDQDLGDDRWSKLAELAQGAELGDQQAYFDSNAATQWIHTPSAIQAAEMLDVGQGEYQDIKILDVGCGSAVWSCAMAHQAPQATVTAIDHPGALKAAQSTAESIGLGDRFHAVPGNPCEYDFGIDCYDLAIIAQRLHGMSTEDADELLSKVIQSLRPAGRLVVIDLYRGPTKANLSESIEALRLDLETKNGEMRSLQQAQATFTKLGLQKVEFSFLAASEVNLGLTVGTKP